MNFWGARQQGSGVCTVAPSVQKYLDSGLAKNGRRVVLKGLYFIRFRLKKNE